MSKPYQLIDENGIPVDNLPIPTYYTYIVSDKISKAELLAQALGIYSNRWVYVNSIQQLHGVHGGMVYLTGYYWHLREWDNIESMLLLGNFTVICT